MCDELEHLLDPTRPLPPRPAAAPLPEQATAPIPTVTTRSRTADPVPVMPSQALGLPKVFDRLPAPLRTQGGLMLMAGGIVLVGMALVYAVLSMAHVI